MNLCITADSTCDLSPALREQWGVTLTPLYILRDGRPLRDGLDITPADIFAHVEAGKGVCTTAAVNVTDYIDVFRRLRETYDAVIHINISAEFSSCYQNAVLAAREVDGVYPVDSRNLSTGSGLLVLRGAELARAGEPAPAVVRALTALTEKVEASFIIEKLDYLRLGGRCSSVAALSAGLLQLKPCIEVRDGKMQVGKKYRGQLVRCVRQYVTERLQDRQDLDLSRVFVTHTCRDRAPVEEALSTVRALQPFAEVLETTAGCTVSNHCGPGTLGVLFLRK